MLAKYKNNKQIERYKGFVIIDGVTYANNIEKAREVGFKDLVVDEQPTYDEQTEWLDYSYIDGDVITQVWVVEPIEETDRPIDVEPIEANEE